MPDPRAMTAARTVALTLSLALSAAAPARAATDEPPAQAAGDAKPDEAKADDKKTWDVANPPGERTDVAIDTTEGTWMSVDVSPDGREIVFDLLGDIYTMPIEGGEPTALRTGVQWDMQPRFSPDGSQIAFTSDAAGGDNIWIMDRDGSNARQISKESFRLLNGPVWAPDGQYIAARKHFTSKRSLGAGEMWLYHTTGGAGVQMTKRPTEQKDVNEPAFSPCGRYLYYSFDATPGRTFQYNKDSTGQIYVIDRLDRETGETKRIAGGAGGAVRPTPAPDGKHIAFVRRVRFQATLFLKDMDSGREWPVYDHMERDMQEAWAIHGVYPAMAWTPDGNELVFWAKGKLHRLDVETKEAREIPFRIKATRSVANTVRTKVDVAPDEFRTHALRSVQVSPAGDRVLFVALGHVYTRQLPDGAPRRLTSQNERFEHDPSFSRDGRSVVFATWSDEHLGDIRTVPAAGGPERVVVEGPGHFTEPVFSPDGETIVFRKVSGGGLRSPHHADETGVFAVPAAGGEPVKIRDRGAEPHFADASDRVFLFHVQAGELTDTRSLVSVGIDGKEERTHYTGAEIQGYRVSPDGKWLAFREAHTVWVTPFVRAGLPVAVSKSSSAVPVKRAADDAGHNLHWSGDSSALHWSLGATLHTRALTSTFAFLEGAPDPLPDDAAQATDLSFTVASDIPAGSVALVGARIVTMNGDEVIENGAVVVERNRITAVGPRAQVRIPAGAHTVDVSGMTIVPGFIDAHAHGGQGSQGIIPQHNWVQYANLAFGVTTIHDPSNDTETFFAAAEMARAGLIRAPRLFSTGTILYGAAGAEYKSEINSLEDARFHLKRQKAMGAFSVKSYNQPRRDQRQQVIQAARELDMSVVPEGGSTFMHNMTMLVDGHTTIEHNIPVETAYEDVLQLWEGVGTGYTPTLVVCFGGMSGEMFWYDRTNVWENERLTNFVPRAIVDPRSRRRQTAPDEDYTHIRVAASGKALQDRGVAVNAGAHGQLAGLAHHWEVWMFGQGGMTPHEALRTATINPARALGMDEHIGTIEPGKLADLLVMERNPLENIRNTDSIRYTMLNGRLFDARTMDQLGNHPDSVGSQAFGEGPDAIGIGKWWGAGETTSHSHGQCLCAQN